MKNVATTKFRRDAGKAADKADWAEFDSMTDAEAHAAAVSDPDCPPATDAQLKRARRAINAAAVRRNLGLTQEQFAAKFGLPLGTIRDWEQGAHHPDRAAQVLLTVIASEPDVVVRALAGR